MTLATTIVEGGYPAPTGFIVEAQGRFGHLASEIPAGTDDVSPLANDGILTGDQYLWTLTSLPASGTVDATDEGAFTHTAGDGTYSTGYSVYILRAADDSLDIQTNTISTTFGASGGTSVTYTSSGSITFSGTNVVKRTRALASSGNLTFSGTNLFEHTKELQPSGGITFSGTGGMTFVPAGATTWTWTPSGSITFSGSSQIQRVRGYNPSGSVTLSGTNVVERVRILTPSGTVNFSGSNVLIKTKQYTPSGRITFISGAAMNFLPEGEASGTASAMTLTFVGD